MSICYEYLSVSNISSLIIIFLVKERDNVMNLISKLGLDGKLGKNFLGVMIVAFAGSIIYGLPYFRYDYYDVYLETYNLTNTQMGLFGTILGVFGMVSYLFGGVVVDKFSTRTILTVSLIGTGIGGFIHLLPLGFGALVCLYAFWGISSLFAFWPACVKAVRILSGEDEQGKAYGFFEGGRGVGAALMAMGAVAAFRYGIGRINHRQVLCKDRFVVVIVAADELNAFHFVFKRRQHGREFTGLFVGRYEDVIGVVFVFLVVDDTTRTVGRALDAVGGALDGDVCRSERAVAVVVNDVVERALRLFAEAELDGGLAYAVFAAMEANGLALVGETAVDTARDVDQCGVDKVDNLRAFEVIFAAVKRERREAVAVHVALDKVFADRNAYLVFAIGIAANALFRLY